MFLLSYLKFILFCFIAIPLTTFDTKGSLQLVEKEKDSIVRLINLAKDKSLDFNKRKNYLDRAFKITKRKESDSLRNVYLTKIALNYLRINDSIGFREANRESILLAISMNDSITTANNYWDLGRFYSKNNVKDSAYYSYSKAEKIYASLGKKSYNGSMLLNMAIIQSDLRDYTGSEVTTIRAIELFKPLKKYKQLYKCYYNLGIIYNELEEYDRSLIYHNKALEFQEKMKGKNLLKPSILNNIGVVFQNNNRHLEAIINFNEALKIDSLKLLNTDLYAMLLDNLAYSKFKLKDTIGVNELFQESLHLRDSIGDISGKTINILHLAEYHAVYNNSIKALQLANEAKDLAEQSKNYRDLLASLILLSKLDKKNSDTYTQRYIALNDKLLKEERAIRDKFARIQFETDEFIEENEALTEETEILAEEKEVLAEQKKRILIIGSVLLVLGLLLYIIRDQRLKNIRLKLEKEQQQANEEIYNLMLTQQYKLD